jgi:hypothetical protein
MQRIPTLSSAAVSSHSGSITNKHRHIKKDAENNARGRMARNGDRKGRSVKAEGRRPID